MDEKLDTGDIVYQKKFNKPNHIFVDDVYDPFIRSETLVELIKKDILKKNNFKKNNPLEGETFFIIHPVLKHISILSSQS
jgi:methionyl-tRNA formyltransferase